MKHARMGMAGIVILAAGCNGKEPEGDGGNLLDTGWFTSTGTPIDPENCPDKFKTTSPADGATDWYWRDRPTLYTETTNQAAYDAWIQTTDGERVDAELVWDTATGLSFTLEWEGALEPDTTYELGIEDCASARVLTFTTSSLGRPLEIEPEALVGNTYLVDLVGAEWVQPAALAGVLQQYFNTPILLGIRLADDEYVKLVGAPGAVDTLGNVTQDRSSPTWNFPLADFTEAPYLDVAAPQIEFQYNDAGTSIQVPVEDFVLTGTLSSDGTELGGGVLSGLGDSRYIGAELLGGDPGDLCVLAEGLGVDCVPCSDGQPYCLQLVARSLEGTLLPELVITD